MYSILAYTKMIADEVRMAAYVEALRATAPGAVVLDIGTGTGIFSLLACQFGAKRVYAIEPDDAIRIAREHARANSFDECINFIQGLSTHVTLPEPVDVIVSDIRGILPLFHHHIPAIQDARARFLAPGGCLIPQKDTLHIGIVGAEAVYQDYTHAWIANAYDLDMRAAQNINVHMRYKARVKPDHLLFSSQVLATLDYRTIAEPDIAATVTWTAPYSGTGYGIVVWFDTELIDAIGFSNSPDSPELIYGSSFFPWLEPVEIDAGDVIHVAFYADLVGDDYVWRWNTIVQKPGDENLTKADFKQSTFFGAPLSPQKLLKRAGHYVPSLSVDGEIDRLVLELMAQALPLNQIATQVADRFSQQFTSADAALARVRDLSEKYSR